jgi:hypothetical protein
MRAIARTTPLPLGARRAWRESSAFCPGPGRETPVFANFTKRDRIHRATLCDVLTAEVERHGRGSNHIGVVADDIDMPWLAEQDGVARSP